MKSCSLVSPWLLLLLLLVSASGVKAAKPDCPLECFSLSTCTTLHDLVAYLLCKTAPPDSQTYNPPSDQLLRAWTDVVAGMLQGVHCSTSELPEILQDLGFQLAPFREDSVDYCVLASFALDEWGQYLAHTCGAVVVNTQDAATPLSIDVPHPLYDDQTWRQGIEVFKGTQAKSFTLSLSHRKATTAPNNQPAQKPCQAKFGMADAAHNHQHTFQANAVAIQGYYHQRHQQQDFTAIQFHGMGAKSCPTDDIFLSQGGPHQAGAKAERLRNALRKQLQKDSRAAAQRVRMVGDDDSDCPLIGSTNVQGRLYNGVPPERVCDTAATSYTGHFLQAEQKRFVRASPEYDRMWIHALNSMIEEAPAKKKKKEPTFEELILGLLRPQSPGRCLVLPI